jgi:hypothetical protein
MPFAQRLNVKGRLWRNLFKEAVKSSQPSAGQKWSNHGNPISHHHQQCNTKSLPRRLHSRSRIRLQPTTTSTTSSNALPNTTLSILRPNQKCHNRQPARSRNLLILPTSTKRRLKIRACRHRFYLVRNFQSV